MTNFRDQMTIGEVSALSKVSSKMIRYYEDVGLLKPAQRSGSGYRLYSIEDVQFLRLIQTAKNLGFSMKDIRELLSLWKNKSRKSSDVKRLAQEQISALQNKIEELTVIKNTLADLIKCCRGDARPDCPILDQLVSEKGDK